MMKCVQAQQGSGRTGKSSSTAAAAAACYKPHLILSLALLQGLENRSPALLQPLLNSNVPASTSCPSILLLLRLCTSWPCCQLLLLLHLPCQLFHSQLHLGILQLAA
jgi:hypothetical protein